MFTHNSLVKRVITRLNSPEGRKYETPEGHKLESVTTWLGRVTDKSYLDEWRNRIGEKEANKITTRAARRGTLLHENVEHHLNNLVVPKQSMLDEMLFRPFAKHLDQHVDNVKALECPLYSLLLRLAGTIDCLAEYDGVISVIDFKTSKAIKNKEDIESYFLQATIYSVMIEEMYGIKANQLVIIIAIDNENRVQVFKENRKNWIHLLISKLQKLPPK